MRASFFSVLLILAAFNLAAQSSTVRWEYVQRYKGIAMDEMKRTGIPASIKLAQGILESNAGASVLARKANNHFGMKCGSEWRGPTYYIKDDDYDENGQLIESCFRAYEDAESSYIAHSEFLRDPNKAYRYGFLFRLDQKDYKKWAQGLKQSGYATSPTYADALISLIDQYKLYNFDTGNLSFDEIRLINDVKMTLAKMGQTPEELAKKYNVKTKCLLKYNEGLAGPNQPLAEGEYIYLQRKRWFFRGKQQFHYVKEGEDMYKISQQYGLKLKRLYRKNKLNKGEEPAVGQKIRLRGRVAKGQSPKLRENQPSDNNTIPLDNGSGKILDMDPTNVVKPSDLPNTNGSSNPANANGAATTNNGKQPNSSSNNDGEFGNKPTTPSGSTTTNSNPKPANPSNGKDSGATPTNTTNSGTKPTPTTNNNTGTKPTSTNNNGTTSPNTTNNTGDSKKPTTTTATPKPDPIGGTKPTTPPTTSSASISHTVKSGDTLYSLSRLYSVSVDQIKSLNGLKDNNIKLGQILIIKK